MPSAKNLAGGIVFTTVLYFSSFFGSIVLLMPFLPLIILKPKWARNIMDFFLYMWFSFAVALYELMLGVKVKIQGRPSKPTDSVLILMNHRTRLDWLFLMSYQLRCGSLMHYKISLKDQLKFVPGPGWAMQCAAFLFLRRRWEADQPVLTAALRYFHKVDYRLQFLLFPEGTDFTANTLSKSDKFAEKNGFPKYRYVLHPRTTGFVFLVQQMKEEKLLDSVLNVSIGYPKTMPIGEFDVFSGNFPEEIHFHVNSTPVVDFPTSSDDLVNWCQNRWSEKEQQLCLYYEKREFSPFENQAKDMIYDIVETVSEESVRKYLYKVIAFWSVFILLVFYSLYAVSLFRWYSLFSIIAFTVLERKYGGLDTIQFLYDF
ncbi:lysocardiolipin acyltransferase 1-like [Haliotis asinina]|uniref:lysocardiolipin acyltransferase 1-like n=1 Tax=Haliotis asinina TaxID=109174 RepID=UPI0035320603